MKKLKSSSPKDAFYQSLVEIGPVILGKIFLISMYFRYFLVISLRKKGRALHLKKLWSEKLTWAFGSGELKIRRVST